MIHESGIQNPPGINDYQLYFLTMRLLLVLIFLVSLVVRLIMVRDLATPAWVDSVHHALITRLILTNGAYPSTYLPYLDISPTVYHPGFHSIAASFVWLTNLDLPQIVVDPGSGIKCIQCILCLSHHQNTHP